MSTTVAGGKWILVAEDDDDDFVLLQDAFKAANVDVRLEHVRDGEEVIECLKKLQNTPAALPHLMILDLNMPKLGGRDVLLEVKASETLQHIPVIIFTNSNSQEEVTEVYRMGANTSIRKPAGFGELKQFVNVFCQYWLTHARLV